MDYLKYYQDKVILVTGGAGAIGSNLVKKLTALNAKMVIVLDDLSSSYKWNVPDSHNVLFVQGSVTDDVMLKRVFLEEPHIIYHLAAFFANQNSVDYPEKDLLVNGLGTLKMLEYSKMCNVERFVYASSGCSIYGSAAPLPLKEDFVSIHLSTPYQITKMLGELYSNFYLNHYQINIVKTRFFNSYGPGEVPGQYRNVIPNFIYRAMKGLPLLITGSGEETRDFCYVDDLVDALLRAGYFKTAVGQEFNIASGAETKIIDLAKSINKIVGNEGNIKYVGRRKWDTKSRLLASVEKAKDLIDYTPQIFIEEGLSRTIAWFKDNWASIENSASFAPGMSSAVRE